MMKHIKSILTLFVICAVVSVALATVNGITAPIILDRQNQAAAGALLEVMPDGGTFEKVDLSEYELPASVKEAHKASNGGVVVQVEWAGFNPGNVTMVGVSADGKVTGTKTITVKDSGGNGKDSATEIPNMDANGHYVGADMSTIDGVDTIGGVTVSTKAYRAAVKDALAAATILGGGSYVSPEQLLLNNLNAALGTEGVEFEEHFFVEVVEGVETVYDAKNGAGYVAVIGGNFIGVANGTVVGSVDGETNAITVSDEDKATAETAVAIIMATTYTDLDLTMDGIANRIISAKVTNTGVYVFEIEAEGWGIHGEYSSGMPIEIKVAITAEGKIISCVTISQQETDNIGSACANEEFYNQFIGKTQDDYTDTRVDIDMTGGFHISEERQEYVSDMDAIAGATVTSTGYKVAIMHAFNAVKIFEGGAN